MPEEYFESEEAILDLQKLRVKLQEGIAEEGEIDTSFCEMISKPRKSAREVCRDILDTSLGVVSD